MIRILIAALVAAFLVACGGNGFAAASGGATSAGAGGTSTSSAGAAAGGMPSAGTGGTSTSSAGAAAGGMPSAGTGGTSTSSAGAAAGGMPSGGTCSAFDASKPSLPSRCQKIQNSAGSPCNAGDTCITLEQAVTSSGPTEDLCQPTAIHTTCAACRETMTCACLAADFTFDKTGLESWKCCDTAAGPLYVVGYSCPR